MEQQTMQDATVADEAVAAPLWSVELKPERVAEGAQKLLTPEERLRAEWVQERLKRMPGWSLAVGGKVLVRERHFDHATDAADFAAFLLHAASRQRFPAEVFVAGHRVAVALQGQPVHAARGGVGGIGGIDDKLLDFAASLG
jgi:pterin-4a-carbinolamine dehydratase